MAISAADQASPVLSIVLEGCWDLVGCWPGTLPACWRCTVKTNRQRQKKLNINHRQKELIKSSQKKVDIAAAIGSELENKSAVGFSHY